LPPEEQARESIDGMLVAAGWIIQNRIDANICVGRGVAVREFPLGRGFGVCWFSLKWRSDVSVSECSALRAGIFKAWGLSIRWRLGDARTSSHAPVDRLDEVTGISLGMVASPQCPLPFRPAKSL